MARAQTLQRALACAAAWAAALGCQTSGPTPTGGATASTSAATTSAAPSRPAAATPSAAPSVAADPDGLPAADRLFVAGDLLLGADAGALWARGLGVRGAAKWRVEGEGVVHLVARGELAGKERLFVARGVGRGRLGAPLIVLSVDPATGTAETLFENRGERNEPATLAFGDVDRDGTADLAFAYFSSKYMVRTHPFLSRSGQAAPEGPEIRMATSRAYADLDGDGKADEVLGRVYGDDKDKPGDLRVDRGHGLELVPTQNGVKSMLVARLGAEARPSLYFCDGWVANYGKEAHAQLKRLRFVKGKPEVAAIGSSPDEFTFFALSALDVDGDGRDELIAQGDKRITVFRAPDAGDAPEGFSARPGPSFEPLLNTAVGRDEAGKPVVYLPGRPNSRMAPL